MLYPIAILPGDDQHAWGVEVPDIPGCFSAGDDLDDAMAMAREAIEGHLEILAEEGAAVPVARKVTEHAANPAYAGCTWAIIDIDVTKYMGKAEKLNITLPGYLVKRINEFVKAHLSKRADWAFSPRGRCEYSNTLDLSSRLRGSGRCTIFKSPWVNAQGLFVSGGRAPAPSSSAQAGDPWFRPP